MNKKHIVSAKQDYIFKEIFGEIENIDALADLLCAILDIPKDDLDQHPCIGAA